MTNIKKTLKTASIWCFVASIIYIFPLLANLFLKNYSIYNIVMNFVSIILSITTGIIYFCFSKNSKETILKNKSLFLILTILNIFTNLIVWFVSFWVHSTITKESRVDAVKSTIYNQATATTNENTNNSNTIILNEDDYEIK